MDIRPTVRGDEAIQERHIAHCAKADPAYGARVKTASEVG